MLKNRIILKKIRNIIILFMVLIIMLGAYSNIRKSRAEEVTLITATAIDNYGYLSNEEFELEAKEVSEELYEIELPESVNTKKIRDIIQITLEDIEGTVADNTEERQKESQTVEIVENKIQLAQEQIDNKKINIEVTYDAILLESTEDNTSIKTKLADKTEEERKQLVITKDTGLLYGKILKYEDEKNNKLVEVRGYLPKDAELQVEEVTKQQIK